MELIVDGATVFAATGGRPFDPGRPVVVFLHGAGCDRTGWMTLARATAHQGWSVLAPDLPGHGRSGGRPLTSIAALSAWTEHLLDAAGARSAALVGHSMGGAIALETAARLGPRITCLVSIGTAAAIPVGKALLEAAKTEPSRAYQMMTHWALAPAARLGRSPTPGMSLTGGVNAVFCGQAADVLAIDLQACSDWTTGPAAAARVVCPSHVIAGEHDIMTPARRGQDLAALIAGAGCTVLPGTGHMIMLEAPVACLAALQAALGRSTGVAA